ncbi:stress-responsive transcription factor hsf1 [Phlyctochytrium planicorne]|nr:stress-responsive transcription factor hsf1 [Phlyctochytrium planicorne]
MEASTRKGASGAAGKRKRTTAATSKAASATSTTTETSTKDLSTKPSESSLLSSPAAAASTTPSHAIMSAVAKHNGSKALSHPTVALPPTAISALAASPSVSTPLSTTTAVLPKPSLSTKNVPAFLTKLYSMVSDVSSNDLIHWSDDGSAFIVHRHEDFARDVLPKFFKHNNFSSFVRQLNMYGFHKIPHIQQGALLTDGEPEMWEFAQPHFKKNQPDLLCLVTRKKSKEDGDKDSLDLSTVLHEISAIKRHQFSISSDLKSIQKENQILWSETIGLRDRYLRQQHTIDRIVRFLASVVSAERPMITKKRRLMLEDTVPATRPKGDALEPELELLTGHEELATPDAVHQRMLDLIQTPKFGSANITAANPTPPPTTNAIIHPLDWIESNESNSVMTDNLAGLQNATKALNDTAKAAASIEDNINMLDIHLNAASHILGLEDGLDGINVHDFFDVEGGGVGDGVLGLTANGVPITTSSSTASTTAAGHPNVLGTSGMDVGGVHDAILSLVGEPNVGRVTADPSTKSMNNAKKAASAALAQATAVSNGKDDLAALGFGHLLDDATLNGWKRASLPRSAGFGMKLGQGGIGPMTAGNGGLMGSNDDDLLPMDTDLDPEFDLLLGGALG